MTITAIDLPMERIEEFCHKWQCDRISPSAGLMLGNPASLSPSRLYQTRDRS